MFTLNSSQRLEVAQIAKELTLQFAGNLKFTDTSSNTSMNDQIIENVSKFYLATFDSIIHKIEGK